MATYKCKAITRTGQVVRSRLTDVSKQNVIKRLKQNDLTPILIEKVNSVNMPGVFGTKKEKRNKSATRFQADPRTIRQQIEKNAQKGLLNKKINLKINFAGLSGVKKDDIESFTQSFYLLKKANFTNIRALSTLHQNVQKPAMKEVIEDILNGVESGEYIYSTMEYYSKLFPPIYVGIIKVGEFSGSLTNSLEQALRYLSDSRKIVKDVKKALTGPLLQSSFLIIVSFVSVIIGLPVMRNLYGQLGVEDKIPEATIAFSNFVTMLGERWYILIFALALIAGAFIYWKSTPSGRYSWDLVKLKVPIFGALITRLQLQKFFKAMQLNLANNAKLSDAIEVSKGVTGNYVMLSIFEGAQSNLQTGQSWIEPFEKYSFFPSMILEMLRIGMETNIVEMIDKIVEFIEEDIQVTMNRIMKTLPEVSNVFMGVILIFFVIVILRPIMEVYLGSFILEGYGM